MEAIGVTRQVVLKGGGLTKPLPVETRQVGGVDFMTLSKCDRGLARLFGFKVGGSRLNVVDYLQKLRDEQVDSLIAKDMVNADPMADVASQPKVETRGRQTAFANANVREVITLEVPAFITESGERIDQFNIDVITTPKRLQPLTVACDARTLQWLAKATEVDWNTETSPPKRSIDKTNLPELQSNGVAKYRRTAGANGGKLALFCEYRTADGKWHRHTKLLDYVNEDGVDTTSDTARDVVRLAEDAVVAFYKENHVEYNGGGVTGEGGDGVGADGLASDGA